MRTLSVLCLALSMLTFGCGDIVVTPVTKDAGSTDLGGGGDNGGGGVDAASGCKSNADCDDGNACTVDSCTVEGSCVSTNAADDTDCNDGDAGTISDRCTAGVCAGTAIDCSALGDGACVAGVFDPATGACTTEDAADGTTCDDGDGGTVADACAAGVCTGTPIDCSALDDPDDCKEGYFESTTGGCAERTVADGTACPVVCGSGTCSAGVCVDPGCDDNDPCTVDSCDTGTGLCLHAVIPSCGGGCETIEDCVDGDPCTEDMCDVASGACSNLTMPGCAACVVNADCDDGDDCTADSCVDQVCNFEPAPGCGGECVTDGDCPPPADTCMTSQCLGGFCIAVSDPGCVIFCAAAADCNDGDPCTSDDCMDDGAGSLVCSFVPIAGCGGGTCAGDWDCPDPVGCLDSFCSADGTCVQEPTFNSGDFAVSVYNVNTEVSLLALAPTTVAGSTTGLEVLARQPGGPLAEGSFTAGSINKDYQSWNLGVVGTFGASEPGDVSTGASLVSGGVGQISVAATGNGTQLLNFNAFSDTVIAGTTLTSSNPGSGTVWVARSDATGLSWSVEVMPDAAFPNTFLTPGPIASDGTTFAALVFVQGVAFVSGPGGSGFVLQPGALDGNTAGWFLLTGGASNGDLDTAGELISGYAFTPAAIAVGPPLGAGTTDVYIVGDVVDSFSLGTNSWSVPVGSMSGVVIHASDGAFANAVVATSPNGGAAHFQDVVATDSFVFVAGEAAIGAQLQSAPGQTVGTDMDPQTAGPPIAWAFDRWLTEQHGQVGSDGSSGSLAAGGALAVGAGGEVAFGGLYMGAGNFILSQGSSSRTFPIGPSDSTGGGAVFLFGIQAQADPWMIWGANVGGEGLQDINVAALTALPDGSWGIGGMFIPWDDGQAWFGPSFNNFGVVGTVADGTDPTMPSYRSTWAARVDGNGSLSCGVQ